MTPRRYSRTIQNLTPTLRPFADKDFGMLGGAFATKYFEAAFGGHLLSLGKGAYGTVYELPVHATHALTNLLPQIVNVVPPALPTALSQPLVIKVQHEDKPSRDMLREMNMLMHTSRSSVTPDLYLGGVLQLREPMQVFSIIVMSKAAGAPLWAAMEHDSAITPNVFHAVHRAIKALWKLGICHNDLHYNNIFITSDHHVTLIDLGFAVRLPDRVVMSLRKKLHGTDSASRTVQAYDQYARDYVHRIMIQRGREQHFRHDTEILGTLQPLVRPQPKRGLFGR